MNKKRKLKIIALIPPIERYVGHWACSSNEIEVHRILMEREDIGATVRDTCYQVQPDYLAVISKRAIIYLNSLANSMTKIPKIFRCQNTVLYSRFGDRARDYNLCWNESGWFRIAADPRWDVILVQTLDDVEVIQEHLPGKTVIACPYGYDPQLFYPEFPENDRDIDIGCYMKVNHHPQRMRLIELAKQIATDHQLRFESTERTYWHNYAELVRRTKIMLNWSVHAEVPFRMYESTVSGAVFMTNPLKCEVGRLFAKDSEYITYQPDFSDLQQSIIELIENPNRLKRIALAGKKRAKQYSWPKVADKWLAPSLQKN